jgi:hypothetical protein
MLQSRHWPKPALDVCLLVQGQVESDESLWGRSSPAMADCIFLVL